MNTPNATLPTVADTHVPVGFQVTVTIGRNVSDKPMRYNLWADFQTAIYGLVRDHFAPSITFGPFTGLGEWEGDTEESSVLIAVTSYPGDPAAFSERLSAIARWFGQDAVAWSYGPNLLATS